MGIGFKGKEKAHEVVDLTADSDEEDEDPDATLARVVESLPSWESAVSRPHHDGRALLTPLPTVLRGDRSGIGSKSSLTKNIKHTSEAIQLLEMKKKRSSRGGPGAPDMSVGGARRFARMAKRDARDRAELLTSMKS